MIILIIAILIIILSDILYTGSFQLLEHIFYFLQAVGLVLIVFYVIKLKLDYTDQIDNLKNYTSHQNMKSGSEFDTKVNIS